MGLSLFPHADTPQFMIDISTPTGSSLSRTDAVLREVETVLDAQPEVKHQLSNLGHGNPRVYYNVFPREDASNYAEVFVQLKAYDAQRTPLFLDRLRARFNAIPGAARSEEHTSELQSLMRISFAVFCLIQ